MLHPMQYYGGTSCLLPGENTSVTDIQVHTNYHTGLMHMTILQHPQSVCKLMYLYALDYFISFFSQLLYDSTCSVGCILSWQHCSLQETISIMWRQSDGGTWHIYGSIVQSHRDSAQNLSNVHDTLKKTFLGRQLLSVNLALDMNMAFTRNKPKLQLCLRNSKC